MGDTAIEVAPQWGRNFIAMENMGCFRESFKNVMRNSLNSFPFSKKIQNLVMFDEYRYQKS
jgi:hypothetical protein